MSSPRVLKDDALFLGALIAVLAGLGFLFHTTGFMTVPYWAGPLLGMALGGIFVYLALVRGRSAVFFGFGIFIALAGIVLLWAASERSLARVWPFLLSSAGLGWLALGLRRWRRFRIVSLVPSVIMVALGIFFSLFSFKIVDMRLSKFIAIWWPVLLILGGIALFVAWSLSARSVGGPRRASRP